MVLPFSTDFAGARGADAVCPSAGSSAGARGSKDSTRSTTASLPRRSRSPLTSALARCAGTPSVGAGLAAVPVTRVEPGEKPRWTPGRVGVLEGGDLAKVLDHSGLQRPLFECLAYTGLRIGEARGLTWADDDFEASLLGVLWQYRVIGNMPSSRPRPTTATCSWRRRS
jgi:integrase